MRQLAALYLFLLSLMLVMAILLFGAVFSDPLYSQMWSGITARMGIGLFIAAGLFLASILCLFARTPRLPHANDA